MARTNSNRCCVARNAGPQPLSVRSRYRVNSGELALAGARQGIGFAIVAAYPCQEDLAAGRLREVPLDLRPAPLQLLGAYSHRHSVTARVRALLELIQVRLEGVGSGSR